MSYIQKLSEQLGEVSLSDFTFYLTRRTGYHSIQVEVSEQRVCKHSVDEELICDQGLEYLLDKIYSLSGNQDLELLPEEYFRLLTAESKNLDTLTNIVLRTYCSLQES